MRRDDKPAGEPLADSLATVLRKSGYMTPGQAAEHDAKIRRQEAEDRARRGVKFRLQCGVFPRYAKASLDDCDLPRRLLGGDEFSRYDAVKAELATLVGRPGIVVLSGANGPGKTHLASALVLAFCDQARAAFYCRAIDFYRTLKSTFGQPGKTAEDVVRRFETFDLLAVDEIEVRSESTWENNELRSLIDARYARVLSTVLITNKPKGALTGEDGGTPYLSDALRDRIRQDGGILECDWPSLRGAAE